LIPEKGAKAMKEIIFEVAQEADGGYTAEALGESIFTQADSWNVLIDGFGNHDPGGGRYNQKKSSWDVIHPGRTWAEKLKPCARTKEEVESSITEFFRAKHGQ
jgi:hypothetical protein